MRSLSAEVTGAIDVSVPEDIAERLERRAEEGHLLGGSSPDQYRVERIEAGAPTPYRTGRGRPAGVRLVELGGRSTASPLEDVTLMFDAGRVRYHVRFPRWRRNGLIAGALLGGVLGLMGVWFVHLSPVVGAFMIALAAAAQIALWRITDADAQTKAHLYLEAILVAEAEATRVRIAEAETEAEAEAETEAEAEAETEAGIGRAPGGKAREAS